MKQILLSTLAVATLATSMFAEDKYNTQTNENSAMYNKNFVIRMGGDIIGSQDNYDKTTDIGTKNSAGFEMAFGAEELIEDFSWGSRQMFNMYYTGESTYNNQGYQAKIKNYGFTTSYNYYYKATQFFEPFIGAGAGLNLEIYNDLIDANTKGSSKRSQTYNPTVHFQAGVSGVLFSFIGYYAMYKYTLASNSTQLVPLQTGGSVEVENNGVAGGRTTAGLNLVF